MNGTLLRGLFDTFAHLLINIAPNIMEKKYIFLLFLSLSLFSFGQTNCEDANSDLIYAYSNVKSSYDSNNISHLKYYANKSLEAFNRSKKSLENCGCDAAYNLSYDAAELLAKVENEATFEDGRFYVKRAREIAKQSITELDKCTVPTTETNDLLALENEQERLEQMQNALKAEEAAIKAKLVAQKQQTLALKKEVLINVYKQAMSSNLETYNSTLEVCDCADKPLKDVSSNTDEISTKSLEDIKSHFIENMKDLASNYLAQLDLCLDD
ncbi:hypothetical protein [Changchengzhania lutea]|uniref:hypothetical protein n=1 Tax=Changchengzhania lutea TaxID=2049305 RepID=UPI00115C4BED|nr:hypothetical protein [Changchengzhania lutea]